MRAIVIDDNIAFARQFCCVVMEQARQQGLNLEAEFLSEENRERVLTFQTLYDLYFLDIEMPGKTGMELARELRQTHPDRELVFVSAHEHYMRKLFPVKPLAFIRKTCFMEDLQEAIAELKKQQKAQDIQMVLGKEKRIIYPAKLIYGQSVEHYIRLVTSEGELPLIRMKLEQLEKELAGYDFLRPHERYLVNLYYIEQIEPSKLLLKNGTEIPVSRSRRKEMQKRLMEWFE
ncbi:MAG: response regulator [Lachnospiraceae bacterium]|jgi:DNA-binding LytR/AlgR family response regulator|nr:response regulator [Lachnospiraceae bacterium]MCX4315770.1 response regulator transcription factor [Lachnospiraceae bacterium]